MIPILNFKNCNGASKTIAVFLCLAIFSSCGVTKFKENAAYRLNYLDEYILENNQHFQGHKIGGLSGIDFNGEIFALISDHSKTPIIFNTNIIVENNNIKAVEFTEAIKINCDTVKSFDTESIRFLPEQNSYLVSTEGNIDKNHNPSILKLNEKGQCQKAFKLPKYFYADSSDGPRQNAVFEGLTLDHSKTGFWIISELPLKRDGKKPRLFNTNSPLRLTHYSVEDDSPNFQLSYDLDRLVKVPFLPFGINGATEILQLDNNYMLVLERGYSAGHKSKGNRIKIFLIDISNQQNLLNVNSLKEYKSQNVKKTLVFDSKKIKNQLKYKFIDNIEGMSFGPILDNGNKSLILVSDNNFNVFGNQINQFLLLELSMK